MYFLEFSLLYMIERQFLEFCSRVGSCDSTTVPGEEMQVIIQADAAFVF
jgi:hypothetical protein